MPDSSGNLIDILGKCLPGDYCAQTSAEYYVDLFYDRLWRGTGKPQVLDLGCGDGRSLDLFKRRDPSVDWVGIDITDSPKARERTRSGGSFTVYDGVAMPFPPTSFDLIYSRHVLEHVRRPLDLLREVRRVLKPGGYYAGSVSQLEPYHGHSFWNYTPLGFKEVVEEAGLRIFEIRPGPDAVALMAWHLRGGLFRKSWWTSETPLNRIFQGYARWRGKNTRQVNFLKLRFCGTFAFLVGPGYRWRGPLQAGTSPGPSLWRRVAMPVASWRIPRSRQGARILQTRFRRSDPA